MREIRPSTELRGVHRARLALTGCVVLLLAASSPRALQGQSPPTIPGPAQTPAQWGQQLVACFAVIASPWLMPLTGSSTLFSAIGWANYWAGSLCSPSAPPAPGPFSGLGPAPASIQLNPCGYYLSVLGLPSKTGSGAMFMPIGSATMIQFPEGMIVFTGSGPGTYSVGASSGPGDAQGATLTVDDGAGGLLPLSSGDGSTSSYLGQPVQSPAPATLVIDRMTPTLISGTLQGDFFVSGGSPIYQMFAHVPARVDFFALSTDQAFTSGCTP